MSLVFHFGELCDFLGTMFVRIDEEETRLRMAAASDTAPGISPQVIFITRVVRIKNVHLRNFITDNTSNFMPFNRIDAVCT